MQHYAYVAMMAMSGVYLTNWAVGYISYATRMIFKSSKVLPVMGIGVLMQGKSYSWQEYSAGAATLSPLPRRWRIPRQPTALSTSCLPSGLRLFLTPGERTFQNVSMPVSWLGSGPDKGRDRGSSYLPRNHVP